MMLPNESGFISKSSLIHDVAQCGLMVGSWHFGTALQ